MLFHRDIFWPTGKLTRWHNKRLPLTFTRHALKACLSDRYEQMVVPPKEILFDESKAFELKLNANKLVEQIAVRVPYNATHDISIVLILDGDEARVKTVWLNDKTDKHGTLNAAIYEKKI